MLRITQDGQVAINNRLVGDLHECRHKGMRGWMFEHITAPIHHFAADRDDVITWLLAVIDDGLLAL